MVIKNKIALTLVVILLAVGAFYFFGKSSQPTKSPKVDLTSNSYTKQYGYSVEILNIKSQFFPQGKKVYIYLPSGKYANQKHPIIYQTDGYSFIEHWLPQIQKLQSSEDFIPPIIVGVDSSENRDMQLIPPYLPGKPRDFDNLSNVPRGQGDRLLAFIKTEVVSHVEKKYSHNGVRMLSGFSMGGLFTLYAFADDPNFFSAYFSFSPAIWVSEGEVIQYIAKAFESKLVTKPSIYVGKAGEYSYGILPKEQEDNKVILHYRLMSLFSSNSIKLSQWRYDLHADIGHFGSPSRSIPIVLKEFL